MKHPFIHSVEVFLSLI